MPKSRTRSILKSYFLESNRQCYHFHERAWQMAPRGTVRKIIGKEEGIEE